MLLLQRRMLGVFVAGDLLLFYVFFELTLCRCSSSSGSGAAGAAICGGKFFLFTSTGSVFTLAGAIYLGMAAGTFNIHDAISFAQDVHVGDRAITGCCGVSGGVCGEVPLFSRCTRGFRWRTRKRRRRASVYLGASC